MSARATNVLADVKVGGMRKVENTDYEKLRNKPSINGVELDGNKTAADLGLGDATDYDALDNKPKINGVPLEGDLSSEDLHIEGGGKTYEFSEGDVDGAISVTPDGEDPLTVKVHGLQPFCFEEFLTEDEILTILNEEDDTE